MNDDDAADYVAGRFSGVARDAFEARLALDPDLARRVHRERLFRDSLLSAAPRMPSDVRANLMAKASAYRSTEHGGWTWSPPGGWLGCGLGFALAGITLALAAVSRQRIQSIPPARAITPPRNNATINDLSEFWSDEDGADPDES